MPRLVLFDIGHVLVELTGAALIHRFTRDRWSDADIHSTWATVPGVRQFETGACDEMVFARSVVAFYDLTCAPGEFVVHFRNAAERKFDGVDHFLRELESSHELACLTNTNPLQWPRISEDFGLGAYFERQYVSYQLGMMKPDFEIYDHVVADTGLAPGEILFIDDNLANCTAARSRGIDTCHVTGFEDARLQVWAKLGLR